MCYLTYDDYINLGGSMEYSDFTANEYKARMLVDERTRGRLKTAKAVPESVKMLVFELVKINYERQKANDPLRIKSEGNDGYSTSYSDGLSAKEYEVVIADTIRSYLLNEQINGIPLLYLGVR